MTPDELNKILHLHNRWLRGKNDGKRAHLQGANLRGADLRGADLQGANLRCADLQGATLRGANLRCADLQHADFRCADLQGATLRGANLQGYQIPQEGELIVWKKLRGGALAKLRVPPESKRTATPLGRKCRAEWVEVLEGDGVAMYDGTSYKAGEVVRSDKYNDDIRLECTHGIHFFLTKEEAEAY